MTSIEHTQRNPHGDEFADLFPDAAPIFVLGAARSGTTITGTAIRDGGRVFGDYEGYLFSTAYLLLSEWDRLWQGNGAAIDRMARTGADDPESARSLARFQFHELQRDVLRHFDRLARPSGTERWVDKTPDLYMLHAAPNLAKAYPRAKFVYCLRSGVAVLDSRRRTLHDLTFEAHCEDWARIEADWQVVAPMLGERAIEVDQHDIERSPDAVAERLATFLDLESGSAGRIAEVFRGRRLGKTHTRRPGAIPDLDSVDWTEAERATFRRICGPAMRRRGFPLRSD